MYIELFPEEKLYLQWTFSRGVIIFTTGFSWRSNPTYNGLFPEELSYLQFFFQRNNQMDFSGEIAIFTIDSFLEEYILV